MIVTKTPSGSVILPTEATLVEENETLTNAIIEQGGIQDV